MIAWSVALMAGAFVILAAAGVLVLIEAKSLMKQVKRSVSQLEEKTDLLAADTSAMIQGTNKAISDMQGHLEKSAPLFESIASLGMVLQQVSRTMDEISLKLSRSAHKHVDGAHQDNEQRLGQMFRYVDAAMTVWHTWQRNTPAPGASRPLEKE
ncbi:DUF948 domain-containing protein [Paenibacillus shunpengii]|uniref:DUF948 domain-containing protein n=1 Tax=Paenibacillus shunpengii TaxID=2054424 RepID=A0ABW5SKK8_9BACL|nr:MULTISPECIES: DUF948 domain-containing protein [unclassified Paenibacillus]OMC71255.1 hypothetical protein BK126_03895 [Paenibacillus sp. FSL H7-0326]SDW21223.1 Uncharacterized protein YoxC, contains an MCP-like domain [Paenibacillus sp. PDC88]